MQLEITKDGYFTFSGGEVHCKVDQDRVLPIIMRDYTMNGFMALAEYVEVLRRCRIQYIDVAYPYFPYARQDREMEKMEPFSLRVFCNLLNSLKLSSVTIYDPHSDVTPALIDNCKVIPQWEIVRGCMPQEWVDDDNLMFVSPDAGAYKKVSKLLWNDKRITIGVKNRGPKGNIIHTDVFSPVDLNGKDCVIVDDICDGGRTFIELAKVLKMRGAKRLFLYVTHGIFSKGLEELFQYFDMIYTTNSFDQSKYGKAAKLIVKEIM
jgi:ribose-phosphate pyrophosphokinase